MLNMTPKSVKHDNKKRVVKHDIKLDEHCTLRNEKGKECNVNYRGLRGNDVAGGNKNK